MSDAAQFTKYEKARILGARALQIAMNAPLLVKIKDEDLEKIHYDALKIAETELNSNVLPISVHQPFPKKKEEEKLKRTKEQKISDAKIEEQEAKEEEEIAKEGEIMELATPEDEQESEEKSEASKELE